MDVFKSSSDTSFVHPFVRLFTIHSLADAFIHSFIFYLIFRNDDRVRLYRKCRICKKSKKTCTMIRATHDQMKESIRVKKQLWTRCFALIRAHQHSIAQYQTACRLIILCELFAQDKTQFRFISDSIHSFNNSFIHSSISSNSLSHFCTHSSVRYVD